MVLYVDLNPCKLYRIHPTLLHPKKHKISAIFINLKILKHTSCVCSWKAYTIPSISCSSKRASISFAPINETIFSIVSITIFRYSSFSSFRSSTIRAIISAEPTLKDVFNCSYNFSSLNKIHSYLSILPPFS